MVENMRRNIRLLAYLKFGHMFMLSMAVIVPYWNSLGLDQQSIYNLQAVFLLSVVVFEVPSGYFADRFGRKNSLVWGQVLWALGWLAYVFASSWMDFALAEVFLGLGVGFTSGADSSLRYDSLMFTGEEHTNLRESSRAISFGSVGEGLAGVIGAGLAVLSLKAPIVAQAVFSLSMTPVVLKLTEAPYTKTVHEHAPWREVWRVTRLTLHDDKPIKWLVLYSAGLGTLTYTAVWLMQPYYLEVGVEIVLLGVLWFVKHMFLAYFGYKSEWICQKLGLRNTLILLPVVGVTTYVALAAGYSVWVLPAWIGFELVRGVQFPVLVDRIHQLTTSDIRATVMSVSGLVLRAFFAFFALVMGWFSAHHSIRQTLVFSAAIYTLMSLVLFIGLDRNHSLRKER